VRGWHVHEVASSPDRLRNGPLLKKNGRFQEVSWDEALEFIVTRLREIRDQHGPDALAFLSSPRCSNEEAYLLQKLARSVIGTNNVDHGAGVYCNNSINVLLDMTGVPASTNSIEELGRSEVIIVDGVDLARQLPTIGGVVIRAKLKGAKLIVIGERRQRVAEHADYFLQLKPGTEALLYAAMMKAIVDRGLMNLPFIKARCRDYDAFLARVSDYDLPASAEGCGVPADLIEGAALAYAGAKSAAVLYSTGLEVREEAAVQAIVNLALLTGQLGREGAGIFALTEHNNSQGVCDVGMLPDRLPGYRAVADPAAREEVAKVWGTKLPATPGRDAHTLLSAGVPGNLKGVWLCRYDPVSTAFLSDAAETLQQCDLVVVQHLFLTETAKYAHVVLPTTAYGEERVTFTSTERRVQLAEQVIEPPPGVAPAWMQLARVGCAMGADWQYRTAADVMDEIASVVPFYSGVSYDNLARDYGRQWPCTKDRPLGTKVLFAEAAAGPIFKFVPFAHPIRSQLADKEHPLTLVFGHSLYYWTQNILMRHSETLKREYRILLLDYPDGFVEMNPEDARRLGIRDGEKIRLCAASGSAITAARITSEVRSGTLFVPFFVRQVQQHIRGSNGTGTHLVPVFVEKVAA
jgi:predicted molibdopterin-dependent oxidoreductase YjgC